MRKKLIALTLSIALVVMGLCVSVGAQQQQQPGQQQQQQPGQQQQQQGSIQWGTNKVGKKPKPAKPAKRHGGGTMRQSGGGQQQQQTQSFTVTGADTARVSAIEAELAILKARPDPSAAIIERIKNL